jgi:anti-sigma B factor antagonist
MFLRGDVDIDTVAEVRAQLLAAVARNGADVVVDCSGLSFIDSTGVTVLLETNRELERYGRHLTIVNVLPGPRRVFELLGVADFFGDDVDPGAR